jgi:cytochrome c biogenesis protein CcdA/thiol-disulfide isomerase/thioredoxin
MLILLLSYFGGILTILSPCVLPVIPLVFARADLPFRRSGLPLLLGMGLSFASFAAFSLVGGSLIIAANQLGRLLALLIFAILGLSLLLPSLAEVLARPLVRVGASWQKRANSRSGIGASLLLGASIGLLWAPCAGPILGLVLAGAAGERSLQNTFALLLVFALGAATSLTLALVAGGRFFAWMKRSLGVEEWLRRGIGIVVLATVFAIALGLDTKVLVKLSYFNTNAIEQKLLDHFSDSASSPERNLAGSLLAEEGLAPPLVGAVAWLNSAPIKIESLRGKVVLIDFWTYSCINCLRTLPYLKAWHEKYRSQGLVIIGVHSPEFAFEKSLANVAKAVSDLQIRYPVAVDSDQVIWRAFRNRYWPAHYFVDHRGQIRAHHFGEGEYEESEAIIQQLLAEAPQSRGQKKADEPITTSLASGAEAPANLDQVATPETYLGYERQIGFASTPALREEEVTTYRSEKALTLNQWGLDGDWKIAAESTISHSANAKLKIRFHARDLHLVLGSPSGKPLPFIVTFDGTLPGVHHGEDCDEKGNGKVTHHRLYNLIRQQLGPGEQVVDHRFEIEFLSPEVEIFAFTFG